LESDEDLRVIQQVLSGRRETFRAVVEKYQLHVFRIVSSLVADRHECEDLAQEVFLAAFLHLESFRVERGTVATWLAAIARNKCLNRLKQKRPALTSDVLEPLDLRAPAAQLANDELRTRLDAALHTLPAEQRTAFALAEIDGLSYEDAANIEHVRLGTIKSRISRARERLRAVLAETVEDYDR
jgi:RNA polymerase sigma-70 factor (ECF subfamily)